MGRAWARHAMSDGVLSDFLTSAASAAGAFDQSAELTRNDLEAMEAEVDRVMDDRRLTPVTPASSTDEKPSEGPTEPDAEVAPECAEAPLAPEVPVGDGSSSAAGGTFVRPEALLDFFINPHRCKKDGRPLRHPPPDPGSGVRTWRGQPLRRSGKYAKRGGRQVREREEAAKWRQQQMEQQQQQEGSASWGSGSWGESDWGSGYWGYGDWGSGSPWDSSGWWDSSSGSGWWGGSSGSGWWGSGYWRC